MTISYDEVASLTSELVAIDSTNPDLVPGGAGEAEIARFVAAWLESSGLDVELHELGPSRANVIAIARGSGGGQTLMLNAHMDVVGAGGWMDSAFLAAAGIPTVIFGPDGEGAHADVEWVDLVSATRTADALQGMIVEFCT